MGKLFTPSRNEGSTDALHQNGPQFQPQQQQAPADYAEAMLKRSGGDARSAFYMACKEKGIDPEAFLARFKNMGNLRGIAQNMIMQDPKVQQLFSLFSMMK